MLCVGLTGGIGSGKSTVAQLLQAQGAALIDADAISRSCTRAHGSAMPAIAQAFGAQMISPDGSLNREAMRGLILQDSGVKASLEAIIHPLVGREMAAQQTAARQAGYRLAVLDIPLLVEGAARWRPQLDSVWVVDSLPATQVQRVQQRSGWVTTQIEAVMAAQASRAERLACADVVIFNEGLSLDELAQEVTFLARQFGL
jgi:dephospho-CoA kinase